DRDLARELHLPGARDDDRAAVLGRVADDGDDDGRDEELARADGGREALDRVDEDLADERGRYGRDPEHTERERQRPRLLGRIRTVELAMAAEVAARDGEIEEEKDGRDRD